jgi:hypothetical protein
MEPMLTEKQLSEIESKIEDVISLYHSHLEPVEQLVSSMSIILVLLSSKCTALMMEMPAAAQEIKEQVFSSLEQGIISQYEDKKNGKLH